MKGIRTGEFSDTILNLFLPQLFCGTVRRIRAGEFSDTIPNDDVYVIIRVIENAIRHFL